ncbi:hypothetical protein FNF28_04722 [Cafeteria roenbergensis]|uniref:RING-type E3 ubiquitin transferase n=1 Tax=Cafeteria roenbergensis TaxID=33653 RepID=A0A5A8DAW7_CAFRO|nr:hypothetical protein FNF28_04722 [Cafeteria roenbergensis]
MAVRARSPPPTTPAGKAAAAAPASQPDDCSICLEVLGTNPVARISGCTHQFCFGCIKTWAGKSNTCPNCKARFTRISPVAPPAAAAQPGGKGRRPRAARKPRAVTVKRRDLGGDYGYSSPEAGTPSPAILHLLASSGFGMLRASVEFAMARLGTGHGFHGMGSASPPSAAAASQEEDSLDQLGNVDLASVPADSDDEVDLAASRGSHHSGAADAAAGEASTLDADDVAAAGASADAQEERGGEGQAQRVADRPSKRSRRGSEEEQEEEEAAAADGGEDGELPEPGAKRPAREAVGQAGAE